MNLEEPIPAAIRARVKRNLYADMLDFRIKRRNEWDGDGYDVLYDIVVLWYRPEETPGKNWGYHSGVIRHKHGEAITVEVFWGHYRRQEAEARKGFLEKASLQTLTLPNNPNSPSPESEPLKGA